MTAPNSSTTDPLYVQAADYIRDKIYSQEWAPGERIPSEHELMTQFGVSRGTVQKAIRSLADEGLLSQAHGKGTFVMRPTIQHPSGSSLLSFAESLRMQGIDFKTQVLEQRLVSANRACASRLQLPQGASVLMLRRVRTAKGKPILYMESRLNTIACPGLERYDYTSMSLFKAIEEVSNKRIGYGRVRYAARVAGRKRGNILGCEEQAPVLNIDQVIFLENNVAVEWGTMWLPADKYVVTSLLRRM